MRITLTLAALSIVGLIGWKLYSIKVQVDEQNERMKKYAEQMEKIIEGADKLTFVTWKDQKEGILFVENPAYFNKNQVDIPKLQSLQNDIGKLNSNIGKQN